MFEDSAVEEGSQVLKEPFFTWREKQHRGQMWKQLLGSVNDKISWDRPKHLGPSGQRSRTIRRTVRPTELKSSKVEDPKIAPPGGQSGILRSLEDLTVQL